MSSNIVLSKVLSKYTSIDFFKEIINISLYPADFSITVGVNEQESVPAYLNTFFNDLEKTILRYNHPQYAKLVDRIFKEMEVDEQLIENIEKYYNQYAMEPLRGKPFEIAKLGNDAGIYGCANMIIK